MPLIILFLAILLSGCAANPVSRSPDTFLYQNVPTPQLWQGLTSATSTREMMLFEAELAVRGETSSGDEYLGRRTSALVGQQSFSRSPSTVADRDCSSFSSSAEAQRFFLSAGGPASDPHGLDRDGDGNACEFGRTIRASASRHSAKSFVAPRPVAATFSSSGCFTGPRGGTYTITASGRKNYGGC